MVEGSASPNICCSSSATTPVNSTENRGNQRGGDESLAGKRGDISSGIRQDFVETEFGYKRRDGAKSIFEGPFAQDEDGSKTRHSQEG
eukprot:scaffold433_cov260-Chaetoceros_neogracile.AAC.12